MSKKGGKVSIGYVGEEVVVVISREGEQATIGRFASVETTTDTILSSDEKVETQQESVEELTAVQEEAADEETAIEEATAERDEPASEEPAVEEEEKVEEEGSIGVAVATDAERVAQLQEQFALFGEQFAELRTGTTPATLTEEIDHEAPSSPDEPGAAAEGVRTVKAG